MASVLLPSQRLSLDSSRFNAHLRFHLHPHLHRHFHSRDKDFNLTNDAGIKPKLDLEKPIERPIVIKLKIETPKGREPDGTYQSLVSRNQNQILIMIISRSRSLGDRREDYTDSRRDDFNTSDRSNTRSGSVEKVKKAGWKGKMERRLKYKNVSSFGRGDGRGESERRQSSYG